MAENSVTLSTALVNKKKPRRTRKRRCFTIPDETFDLLKDLVEDYDLGCPSRAIDEAVQFYVTHGKSIQVKLSRLSTKKVTAHFLKKGRIAGEALGEIAERIVLGGQKK